MVLQTARRAILVLAILTAALTAYAEGAAAPPSALMGLEINGLRRTQRSVVEGLLQERMRTPTENIDLVRMEADLRATGLFSDVELSLTTGPDGKRTLVVDLTEKWTLLPIPFAAYSGGSFTGGGFLMDANLTGANDALMVGGFFSSGNGIGILNYLRRPKAVGDYGWGLSAAGGTGTNEVQDGDGEKLFTYDDRHWDLGFQGMRKLTNGFSAQVLLGFSDHAVTDSPIGSSRALAVGLGGNYQRSSWNGWFLSQTMAEAEARYSYGLVGSCFPALKLRGNGQLPILDRARILSNAALYWSESAPQAMGKTPMEVGISILPKEFKSSRLAGFSAGAEYGILKTKAGVLSAYLSGQAILAEDFDSRTVFDYGPAGGMKFYLSKIAFPALSVGAAYNAVTDNWESSVSIGFGF